MNFLMGKPFAGILMMLMMLNLAVNVRHVVAMSRAFCDGNWFQDNECGKYCGDDKSKWCDTSRNLGAKIGDQATECQTDPNICRPEWDCVSPCKMNLDLTDRFTSADEKFDD